MVAALVTSTLGVFSPSPASTVRTPGCAARSSAPAWNPSRMAGVSMRPPGTGAAELTSARISRSPSSPSGTNASPGLVQNCPSPSVNEPARPRPISSARSATAAGVTTNGLMLPSSP
jgi:hypothetical protein